MFNKLEKLSKKKIILISVGLILLMGLTTVLYIYKFLNETVFTIVLFLLLITFSTFTSTLFQRHLNKKMEDKKKGEKLKITRPISFINPLKQLKANFGEVQLYLKDKVLYSLILVNDTNVFFSEDQQQVKYNIDKKKYDKMIQFYLFDIKDYNSFRKISILNYQSKILIIRKMMIAQLKKLEKAFYL